MGKPFTQSQEDPNEPQGVVPIAFVPMDFVYTSVDKERGILVVVLTKQGVYPPPAIVLDVKNATQFLLGLRTCLAELERHPPTFPPYTEGYQEESERLRGYPFPPPGCEENDDDDEGEEGYASD